MLKAFALIFGPSPRQVQRRQLHDAQIQLLKHAALAEHHEAMTLMYRDRCERLSLDETPGSHVPTLTEQQTT